MSMAEALLIKTIMTSQLPIIDDMYVVKVMLRRHYNENGTHIPLD